MFPSFIRIALLAGLVFGGYKLYPRVKPALAPILSNPIILGAETLEPAINKVNDLLPNNIQIPTPKQNSSTPSEESTQNPAPSSTVIKDIVDEVKQKAGEAAQDQIDVVKKETGNAFCAALVETIKKQCGIQ